MGVFLLESRVCYKKNAAEQIQRVSSSAFKLFLLLNFKCLVQLMNLLGSFWLASLEVELGNKTPPRNYSDPLKRLSNNLHSL